LLELVASHGIAGVFIRFIERFVVGFVRIIGFNVVFIVVVVVVLVVVVVKGPQITTVDIIKLNLVDGQEETRLANIPVPGTELSLELVDTPQPKKPFRNFRQIVQNHRDQTVASVTT
jgi:hypothetical protein